MTRRDDAVAPHTRAAYRRAVVTFGNLPHTPARQVSQPDLAHAAAVLGALAGAAVDRHAAALLRQAVVVTDEAVRAHDRRAGRPVAAVPALGRLVTDDDVAATRTTIARMLDGGECLARWEGAQLRWAAALLDHP